MDDAGVSGAPTLGSAHRLGKPCRGLAQAYRGEPTAYPRHAGGWRRITRPDPLATMNGAESDHICDPCNRRIEDGDKTGVYATWYDEGWWTPRRSNVSTVALRR
jgi:hypothetical protein